jgi:hypothetical protein
MKIAIHQPQYMPWLGYFHKMASVDLFVLLDDVQFKKNEWQHRNRIRNAEGWQWLSVPNAYRFPQKILEVPVLYQEDWRRKHLLSIASCYGKARYFNELFPQFEEFFKREWPTIDKVNIDSIALLAGILGVTTPVVVSSNERFDGASTERLVNICKFYKANTYLAGAGGHDYMDLVLFERAGINVEFQEFKCPVHEQHWASDASAFIPGLSAIDLVFNCGPGSVGVLLNKSPMPS